LLIEPALVTKRPSNKGGLQMVEKSELNEQYWIDLKNKSALAGITLDEKISPEDFRTYGDRLARRQIEMFEKYGTSPLETSTIVDVGCGLRRISLPFSKRFGKVVGIDINRRILDAGAVYCQGAENIEFVENDGKSIPLADASVDYSYSGGVLQHIKDLGVIVGYFHEGLRVLKPGGTLNYSIQIWMDDIVSGHNIGKKVTAADLEAILAEHDCELLALVEDPKDPIPHMNVIIRKRSNARPEQPARGQVNRSLVIEQPVRTGIWEDLPSYQNFKARDVLGGPLATETDVTREFGTALSFC